MDPRVRGDLTEGFVIAQLLKLGYTVSKPFGDNQRYDLVVDDGEQLLRIQVKTGRFRQGCIVFPVATVNGSSGKRTSYHGQIDSFVVFCPEKETFYNVPIEACGDNEMRLRVDPPKGGPRTTINWAKDFELKGAG